MSKYKAPKILCILINNKYVISCKEKANEFVKYFSQQCKPLINNSTLPNLYHLTDERLNHIPLTNDDILSQIRSLNINKSSGSDEISARMLMLCDDSIVVPLKLIFTNILSTGVYLEMWKLANVISIHKKCAKQLSDFITNYLW